MLIRPRVCGGVGIWSNPPQLIDLPHVPRTQADSVFLRSPAGLIIALTPIEIPDSVARLPFTADAEHLIDTANEAIEAFMLRDTTVIENFVTSDFHLCDQALTWIEQNNLLTGNYFVELGAGFGVCAMLAALHGMHAYGIEIESDLFLEATRLADQLGSTAKFFQGSYIQPGAERELVLAGDGLTRDADTEDLYAVIDRDFHDFDLIFAFPWPSEYDFFESMFDMFAASNALLLTYRGREGMHLLRKN